VLLLLAGLLILTLTGVRCCLSLFVVLLGELFATAAAFFSPLIHPGINSISINRQGIPRHGLDHFIFETDDSQPKGEII